MHIGIDFDNTVVGYDELFYRCALERELIPPDVPPRKVSVRAYLWSLPDGNRPWTELQGIVYGSRMAEAAMCPGVDCFLEYCRDRKIKVSIVSHKIVYPSLGPRVDMREAAAQWIEDHGFFGESGLGLSPGDVYFESSREDKIARIAFLGCTRFIDDLLEVLTDNSFPEHVRRILYASSGLPSREEAQGVAVFRTWMEILEHIRNEIELE